MRLVTPACSSFNNSACVTALGFVMSSTMPIAGMTRLQFAGIGCILCTCLCSTTHRKTLGCYFAIIAIAADTKVTQMVLACGAAHRMHSWIMLC